MGDTAGNKIFMLFYFIHLNGWLIFIAVIILLFLYRRFRARRWKYILKASIKYHKFYLTDISNDPSIDRNSRDLAHSLLWGITKQLPLDIKEGKGGVALYNSLSGKKTSLNTCGTVFYECAKNHKTMDPTVFSLTNTLISTIYRIFILESHLSVFGLLYYDINLLYNYAINSVRGSGRLYLDLTKKITKNN